MVQRKHILTTQVFRKGVGLTGSSEPGHLGDLSAYQVRTDLKDGQTFLIT